MTRLNRVSMKELYTLLDEVEGSTPVQRVLAAISYKQGDSTSRLAERHNVSQQTIRNWLKRFENRAPKEAPFDEPRNGRPSKLTQEEHDQLLEELQQPPQDFGFERQAWFPRLVHHHLKTMYGVEYSIRHIRRLMKEAGLTWRTARPHHHNADPELKKEFQEAVKKTDSN